VGKISFRIDGAFVSHRILGHSDKSYGAVLGEFFNLADRHPCKRNLIRWKAADDFPTVPDDLNQQLCSDLGFDPHLYPIVPIQRDVDLDSWNSGN
jgi:hypothetical protein